VILRTLDAFGVGSDARSQHDMRFDNLAAPDIGGSDHATLGYIAVRKRGGFDLGAGDVVVAGFRDLTAVYLKRVSRWNKR